MKKVPDNIDDPTDTFLVNLFDKYFSEFFKRTGHTANILTTYSLITGLISGYFLNMKKLLLFSIFYMISYFFDCADGHFARKYGITSDVGDFYDHIKDVSVSLLIIYISFKNSRKNINSRIIAISLVFIFLSFYHLSCKENNCDDKFKNKNNKSLQIFSSLCKNNMSHIRWSRFFGSGTLNIFFIVIICYINRN
jgi:phosphatidylglycerophosphate synthase